MEHVALLGDAGARRVVCAAVPMIAAGDCRAVSCEAESVSVSNVGGGACNGSGWLVVIGKRLLL
jgi:hypothetical protein